MPSYVVGSLYNLSRTSWPEASQYNYRAGQHELVLFFPAPSKGEVLDARKGDCEFALFVEAHAIFLLYRFGKSIQWSDAPFSYWLVPENERSLPDIEGNDRETRALLQVLLVDAATGILRVIRTVSFSPAFTRAIHQAIRDQAARPFLGQQPYDRWLVDVYRQYPTSTAMVRGAVARTKGGA
jgi:hypothetical protein